MVITTTAIVTTAATGAVLLAGNIVQAFQNRELRKQIKMLKAIIDNLENDIAELRKELKALKIWCFKQRKMCRNEISKLEKEKTERELKLNGLEQQLYA